MLPYSPVVEIEEEVAQMGYHFEVTSVSRHSIYTVRHNLFEPFHADWDRTLQRLFSFSFVDLRLDALHDIDAELLLADVYDPQNHPLADHFYIPMLFQPFQGEFQTSSYVQECLHLSSSSEVLTSKHSVAK